jgi:hypothetical protein
MAYKKLVANEVLVRKLTRPLLEGPHSAPGLARRFSINVCEAEPTEIQALTDGANRHGKLD